METYPRGIRQKKELKVLAIHLAEMEKLEYRDTEKLLMEVDRLKSAGKLTEGEILNKAYKNLNIYQIWSVKFFDKINLTLLLTDVFEGDSNDR